MAKTTTADDKTIGYDDLLAQKAQVEQETDGLRDLVATPTSAELRAARQAALDERNHRLELIVNLLNAWDALLADGYPELPIFTLPPMLQTEHDSQLVSLRAGAGVFGPPPPSSDMAAGFNVTLGTETPPTSTRR